MNASAPGVRLSPGGAPADDAGPEGNERLTTLTGAVLLLIFIAECLTVISVGSHLGLHFFLGMLLLGPVAVKIGSTLYRFGRYDTGAGPYVRRGAPAVPLRVLGPFVILTSLAVLVSGIALAVLGPGRGGAPQLWLKVHQVTFYLWLILMIFHVGAHLPQMPRILFSRPAARAGHVLASGPARWLLLGASLAGGLVVALLTYHLSGRWSV
jgi:hypothetical protein